VRGLETGTVRIIVDVPRDLTIFADHARIRQVLSNLLANALHHSPVGTTVTLSGAREPDAVVLRVTDEGPGVPSDIMPRVFTRYARGPRSTGLGIGLYLAERIVAAHGGTLVLDSTPSGATFTLRLPGPSEGTVAKTDADAERVAEYTD
jgi:signal transduction histidine kinase